MVFGFLGEASELGLGDLEVLFALGFLCAQVIDACLVQPHPRPDVLDLLVMGVVEPG